MGRRSSMIRKTEGLSSARFPIKVQCGENGIPRSVLVSGQWEGITSVVKHWDVSETLSGEKRLIKSYFEVVTEYGSSLRLLLNIVTGSWYREERVTEGEARSETRERDGRIF